MSGPPPIITLTTDFGLQDPYVAAMKGAILTINPTARLVDVSHAIRPQAIEQAAFVLAAAWPYFPTDAIHVAVVDPAVGSGRRALALRAAGATFVGPDNGVLSAALPDDVRAAAGDSPHGRLPAPVGLPPAYRAVSLTNERFFRTPVSSTFHGRDIFGPVAAHLSLGVALEELGEPVERIIALPPFRARRQPDGSLRGRVLHIDAFGNLITDVRLEDLPSRERRHRGGGPHSRGGERHVRARGGPAGGDREQRLSGDSGAGRKRGRPAEGGARSGSGRSPSLRSAN